MAYLAVVLVCSLTVGDTYSSKVTIEGVGEIALPPGEWVLEHSVISETKDGRDGYVFKKVGDRLERLTFQRYFGSYRHPIPAYFDSIGDSTSNGIPTWLSHDKNEHDLVDILRPAKFSSKSKSEMIGSFIYTSEAKDPWMSHALVCDCESFVLVCVHASPFAISPETLENVYDESRIQKAR